MSKVSVNAGESAEYCRTLLASSGAADRRRITRTEEGSEMTAVADRHSAELIESTAADARRAVRRALDHAGMTYDQLQEQARHDGFTTMAARMAWVAVRDLREFSD